jgi:hypothetical protein
MPIPARTALFLVLSLTHSPAVSFAQSRPKEQRYNTVARAALHTQRLWGGTVDTLPVSPHALRHIRAVLHREGPLDPEDRVDVGAFAAIIVTLGTTPHQAIEVTASGYLCGATGNCTVWLFDRNTGATLITDNGYDFLYAHTLHHGLPDISVQHNLSCCEGTRNNYRFDGIRYKLLRSVTEETQPR